MDIDTKINLITRNLSEIVGSIDVIKKIISVRPLKIYFGTAPTGKIHIGYCIPIIKICNFLTIYIFHLYFIILVLSNKF